MKIILTPDQAAVRGVETSFLFNLWCRATRERVEVSWRPLTADRLLLEAKCYYRDQKLFSSWRTARELRRN